MSTANGFIIGDGSWNLQIYVSDLQVERTLRVKGDLHIGGVMLRLVEDLGEWSLHSIVNIIAHSSVPVSPFCCPV